MTPTDPAAGALAPVAPRRGARRTQVPGSAGAGTLQPPRCEVPAQTSPQPSERQAAGTPDPATGAGGLPSSAPGRVRAPRTPAGGMGASPASLAGSQAIAAVMSEAELEEHVRELCKGLGIVRIHIYNSRGTTPGVPDDILIGPRGILWRELKTQRGKVTAAQQAMGEALTAAGQNWAVWRPASLPSGAIAAELAAISAWRTRRGGRCVCDAYGSCPQGCAMCAVCGGEAA